jgi:light-regulated signal transduction histidine kinase (bacteriophytochrome)
METKIKNQDDLPTATDVYSLIDVQRAMMNILEDYGDEKKNIENVNVELENEILRVKNTELALISSNNRLEEFAYMASHDLKAPLRHIMSFVDLLSEKLEGSKDAEIFDYTKRITKATRRMHDMINAILDLSRLSNQFTGLDYFDLEDASNEVITYLKPEILASNPEIIISSSGSLRGDIGLIKIVLQNLLQNAIKYRKKEKLLKIEITSRENQDHWEVSVQDNGIGFENSESETVFRMFGRLVPESEFQGTGIGLAICKKIIELHEGTIGATSNTGVGSRFFFTLPKV